MLYIITRTSPKMHIHIYSILIIFEQQKMLIKIYCTLTFKIHRYLYRDSNFSFCSFCYSNEQYKKKTNK